MASLPACVAHLLNVVAAVRVVLLGSVLFRGVQLMRDHVQPESHVVAVTVVPDLVRQHHVEAVVHLAPTAASQGCFIVRGCVIYKEDILESMVPLSFVCWLFGFLVVLLGGCWAIFKYFESKLNTVYKRMDDNKKGYYNDFVLLKVFEEANTARKEVVDQKFIAMGELFTEKLDGLRREIQVLTMRTKDHVQ